MWVELLHSKKQASLACSRACHPCDCMSESVQPNLSRKNMQLLLQFPTCRFDAGQLLPRLTRLLPESSSRPPRPVCFDCNVSAITAPDNSIYIYILTSEVPKEGLYMYTIYIYYVFLIRERESTGLRVYGLLVWVLWKSIRYIYKYKYICIYIKYI